MSSALRPVDLRIRVRTRPGLVRGEQRGGLLDRGEVPPVAVAVGDQHVQELPRLVPGAARVQDAGHLGQPGPHGGGQAAVPLDHQPARRQPG